MKANSQHTGCAQWPASATFSEALPSTAQPLWEQLSPGGAGQLLGAAGREEDNTDGQESEQSKQAQDNVVFTEHLLGYN